MEEVYKKALDLAMMVYGLKGDDAARFADAYAEGYADGFFDGYRNCSKEDTDEDIKEVQE